MSSLTPRFIILGYGVPRNIFSDRNYQTYLSVILNTVFSQAESRSALIVFSGGPTDCFAPYRRTEASEIHRAFVKLMRRQAVRPATRRWQLAIEARSLTTPENLLFCRRVLKPRKSAGPLTIFCEVTRRRRIARLARRIFSAAVQVQGIDFDVTSNRYLSGEDVRAKERRSLRHDLRTLTDPGFLRQQHWQRRRHLLQLRRTPVSRREEVIRQIWHEGQEVHE